MMYARSTKTSTREISRLKRKPTYLLCEYVRMCVETVRACTIPRSECRAGGLAAAAESEESNTGLQGE